MGWVPAASLLLPFVMLSGEWQWRAPRLDTHVLVRVHDSVGVNRGIREAALNAAAAILADAGVSVRWHRCEKSDEAPPSCRVPLGLGERVIQFANSRFDARTMIWIPLGEAVIDLKTKTGVLATVFVDRVEWKAKDAGISVATLMGRAVAHEIGHLLLGSANHSDTGLMRGLWSTREIIGDKQTDWTFNVQDSARLRASFGAPAAAVSSALKPREKR